MRRIAIVATVAGVWFVTRSANAQSTGVFYEAVNNYSACNGPSLSNPIANAQGFINSLTSSGYWTKATNGSGTTGGWTDGSVWVTDFFDPDRTGNSIDNDTSEFDHIGNAFSYYAGHGVCDDRGDVNAQHCNVASDCGTAANPAPSGTVTPAFCRYFNGDPYGNCMYHSYSRTLAVGDCTHEPAAGGRASYSSGNVKLGESSNSGTWGGAGTNGGVNFAVFDNSCSLLAYRESEVFPLYAGVHTVAYVGRLTGDTAMVSDRGSAFANMYNANPSGSAAYAWAQSMANIASQPPNGSCVDRLGHNLGGGQGVNGCGMNEAVSLDSSVAAAQGKTNQPWQLYSQDFRDAQGSGYWSEVMNCNWDCTNNPGRR